MRWAAVVLLLAAACALEPRQSAVFESERTLSPRFYVVMQGDGISGLHETRLDFGATATSTPDLPALLPDVKRAWLFGWDEPPADSGAMIREALDSDRYLAKQSFASRGTIDGSTIRFREAVREFPPLALVDNDMCQSIETPTVRTVGCDTQCNVSVSRDLCRLDVIFSGCAMATASFRLGDQVEPVENSALATCRLETRTSPGVSRFSCTSGCQIHVIEPETQDWLRTAEQAITDPASQVVVHSDFGNGPFPGLTIVDNRLLVPVYDGPWPASCERDPRSPTTIWSSDLDFGQTETATSGSCAGVPRAHNDGTRLWWGFQTGGPGEPPPPKQSFIGLFDSTRRPNWPTQLDNFAFAELSSGTTPLRIQTKGQTAWVITAKPRSDRMIEEATLYEVRAQNESWVATEIPPPTVQEAYYDVAVDPESEQAFALTIDTAKETRIHSLSGDVLVQGESCSETDHPTRRFKVVEGHVFGFSGADGALHITRLSRTNGSVETNCKRLNLTSQWGPVIEVAPWKPGIVLVAQLDLQGVLHVQRVSLVDDMMIWPAFELGRGPIVDLTPGPDGQLFGLLPQSGTVIRLTPTN